METVVEICTGSVEDGLKAFKAGAKRIELNSALSLGGLSPSLTSLQMLKERTGLEIICMVRPRSGGFSYSDLEKEEMLEEARLFLSHGADGIAFGFLNPDRSVDQPAAKEMIDLIHSFGKTAVFHRAVDLVPDYDGAVAQLIELGADRILTSGQKDKALDGADNIARIQSKFGGQIEILAGSGVNEANAKKLLEKTGISQIHSSCSVKIPDAAASSSKVSFENPDQPGFKNAADENKIASLIGSVRSC